MNKMLVLSNLLLALLAIFFAYEAVKKNDHIEDLLEADGTNLEEMDETKQWLEDLYEEAYEHGYAAARDAHSNFTRLEFLGRDEDCT